jgi:hypothetical protein
MTLRISYAGAPRAAQLETENQGLKYQLYHHKITRTRKRVQVDPNKRYSNAETIQAAINQAAALQAQQAAPSAEKAARTLATATASLSFNFMCTQWQT